MQLFYTPNSPYARVARVVARLLEVPLTEVAVAVRDAADELLLYNPAAKVPSLALDDGLVLSDSRLICEHLQHNSATGDIAAGTAISTAGRAVLVAPVDDIQARHWEGVVSGFLDGIAVWVREHRRPEAEQSPGVLVLEEARCLRCLAYFEQHWPAPQEFNYAAIMLGSALELLDVAVPLDDWRQRFPRLAAWSDEVSARQEMRQTKPQLGP